LQHVLALPLELVLDQLWIAVGPDRHWCCLWKEMNAVVVAARRWKTRRRGEDVIEILEKHRHKMSGRHGVRGYRCSDPGCALPHDVMVVVPAAHACVSEVLQYRPECA
jgi:hypothetical protein